MTGGRPQMMLRHPAAAASVAHARISGTDGEAEKSKKSMKSAVRFSS
ncbi:hypothetical protein ABT115_20870 [Streptomyces sp. NPDC001832]